MAPNVVIIGGGFAGSSAARILHHHFNVTLIDTKDYFEFTPSILRLIAHPHHAGRIRAKHHDYLKHVRIITHSATRITRKDVHTPTTIHPYDYLLITAGAHYGTPLAGKAIYNGVQTSTYPRARDILSTGAKTLIIGGGIVGIELATEILQAYPQCKLTIAQGGPVILPRSPRKAQVYATKHLTTRGAQILTNTTITHRTAKGCTTRTGATIEADIIFICTGIQSNTEHFRPFLTNSLDQRGAINVHPTLQVIGQHNVLAAGDITSIPEEKLAQCAQEQGSIAAQNIIRLAQGKTTLLTYKPRPRPVLISLGETDAILTYKTFTLTGRVPSLLKHA
ncbi:MAG: FAD-dependent oxidoreductase, partial [Nitrosarchaeum sp.]|nr:FAD-dependent oxidoreductase [Nitrosarchaeum sp.]